MPEEEKFPFEKEIKQQKTVEPKLVPEKRNVIPATTSGVLVGSTFEDQFRLARAYHASGLMPKALNTPEKVLVALQLCRELGLSAMASIGKICVINGSPSIFGDLPLALVMKSGKLKDISEEIPETGDFAKCTVTRICGVCVIRSFTIDDAKRAGLWARNDVWSKYPKRMLQMRARSWALKDLFPDVLMGISIGEYDHNTVLEEAGKMSSGADLNKDYLDVATEEGEEQ